MHLTGRIASTELEVVPGQVVPKGTQVVTLLAAANRDPAKYDDFRKLSPQWVGDSGNDLVDQSNITLRIMTLP